MKVKSIYTAAMSVALLTGVHAQAEGLPSHPDLKQALNSVVKETNGGFGFNM